MYLKISDRFSIQILFLKFCPSRLNKYFPLMKVRADKSSLTDPIFILRVSHPPTGKRGRCHHELIIPAWIIHYQLCTKTQPPEGIAV